MQSTDETRRIFPVGGLAGSSSTVGGLSSGQAGDRRLRRGLFAEAWRWAVVLVLTVSLAIGLFGASMIAAI
jgi:hypothetical protein